MADEIENGQKAKPEKMLSDEQKAKLAESQGVTDAEIADGDPDGSLEQKDIDTPIDNKGSKFETFFDAPYSEIKVVLRDTIKPDQRIIDLGANKGNLEDFLDTLDIPVAVECVDTDQQALEELKAKQFENLQIEVAPMDANDFVDGYTGDNVDIALVNATLHEINTPSDQRQYLQHFFERMRAILKQEGRVIVGDYYYPDSVTDEEVASFIEYQKKAINHADAREKFVKPELLCEIGQESGFLVEHTKEIRAVKEIDRRYYIVVLRKAINMLTISSLKSGYDEMEIIRGIDIVVNPGEIIALVGPNGAGKSTILKSIFNLADIYDGRIIFKDKDITKLPTHELISEGISFVPQGRQVFSDMTVMENLEMGAFIFNDKELFKRNILDVFEKFPILKEKQKHSFEKT